MGTFNPGVEPELEVAVHRSELGLFVDGDLERGISPKMAEALAEGVPMALTFETEVAGRAGQSVTRVLSYLPLTRQWQVSRSGESPRTFATRAEAERAWGFWNAIPAGAAPPGEFAVVVRASLSFPGRPDWKADLVWKAPVVTWTKTYSRLSEIPF